LVRVQPGEPQAFCRSPETCRTLARGALPTGGSACARRQETLQRVGSRTATEPVTSIAAEASFHRGHTDRSSAAAPVPRRPSARSRFRSRLIPTERGYFDRREGSRARPQAPPPRSASGPHRLGPPGRPGAPERCARAPLAGAARRRSRTCSSASSPPLPRDGCRSKTARGGSSLNTAPLDPADYPVAAISRRSGLGLAEPVANHPTPRPTMSP
jgi:hypothetical protein